MENFNTTFLEELYILEPSLKEKETEILALIDRMTLNRPAINIDESFKMELKKTILKEFAMKKTSRVSFFTWWNMALPVSLAAFAGIFMVSQYIGNPQISTTSEPPMLAVETAAPDSMVKNSISLTQSRENLQEKAFWSLTFLNTQQMNNSTSSRPQSGGGGMGNMAAVTNPVVDSDAKMDARMMTTYPVDMPVITYSFSGELELPTGSLPVYERSTVPFNGSDVANLIVSQWMEWFNLSAINNPKLTMLSFVDTASLGYSYNIDFVWGTFSIYQNYETWPQPVCNANGCESLRTLTASDLESNDAIIAKASNFLNTYNIDTSWYGSPMIDQSAAMPDGMIPEMITVTYPTLLDGKVSYEENGGPRGLTLTYDVRNKKVSSFYGLWKDALRSSDYPLTTNSGKVVELLAQGGRWGSYMTPNADSKKINVSVKSPEIGYMRLSHMDEAGKYKEYLIPAFIFQVEKSNDPTVYTPNIITIPLIDDFLNIETPTPMPIDIMAR